MRDSVQPGKAASPASPTGGGGGGGDSSVVRAPDS